MTVVSSKEFVTNQKKYFDLAANEKVVVETYPEQPILEPDDNLRNAITFDELLERTYEDIHQMFAKK